VVNDGLCRGQALPEDQHFVAAGLCARRVSEPIGRLRQLTFAPNGDLFGQADNGGIYLFRDTDGDGVFSKSEGSLWAASGSIGNNVHVDAAGGFVYAGFATGVKRFAYDPSATKGGASEDVVVGAPSGGHPKHTVHVYDGFLYVHTGSGANVSHEKGDNQTAYDTKRSLIKRFDLSKFKSGTPFQWDAGEPFTVGLRNINGFKRNETTKKIYGVVNGIDNATYLGKDVHDDNPGEQVLEIAAGKKYGYPFCFTAQAIDGVQPGTQLANVLYTAPRDVLTNAWCEQNSEKPTTFVQAHSAPLDIVFFDEQPQGGLPEKWRGGAFIALHGSWNRSEFTGYKVVWQPFNADGSAPMPTSGKFPYEVVFGKGTVAGGPVDGQWKWAADGYSDGSSQGVRPAGVAVSPVDGALYIATDSGGLIYRIGLKK
jgi:glucose/arabinose dehydrogenase